MSTPLFHAPARRQNATDGPLGWRRSVEAPRRDAYKMLDRLRGHAAGLMHRAPANEMIGADVTTLDQLPPTTHVATQPGGRRHQTTVRVVARASPLALSREPHHPINRITSSSSLQFHHHQQQPVAIYTARPSSSFVPHCTRPFAMFSPSAGRL